MVAPRMTNVAGAPVNAEITIQITAEMVAGRPPFESILIAWTLASIMEVVGWRMRRRRPGFGT